MPPHVVHLGEPTPGVRKGSSRIYATVIHSRQQLKTNHQRARRRFSTNLSSAPLVVLLDHEGLRLPNSPSLPCLMGSSADAACFHLVISRNKQHLQTLQLNIEPNNRGKRPYSRILEALTGNADLYSNLAYPDM